MKKISEHISFAEATKSQTGSRLGIENIPGDAELKAMKLVAAKIFEPVRKAIGKPIFISSFYRCALLNQAIGGAPGSQHMKGEAMDLDLDGLNAEIFYWIKNNLEFDQLIWEFGDTKEPDWVHVSYKEKGNLKEVLRAVRVNKKAEYKPFDL